MKQYEKILEQLIQAANLLPNEISKQEISNFLNEAFLALKEKEKSLNLNLLKKLSEQANYLKGVDCIPSAELMDEAIKEIKILREVRDINSAAREQWGKLKQDNAALKISNEGYKNTIQDLHNQLQIALNERKSCFIKLNEFRPDITGGSNLDAQITKLLTKLQIITIEKEAALEQRATDWARIKDLEGENNNYSERIHNLEEENGMYWEKIGELEEEVKNLKTEILLLKNKGDE